MLRLLAQREQGYEDMAALMGVSVEELRGRVKEALSELEKEGQELPQLPPEPGAPKAEPEPPKAAAPAPPPVAGEPPELSATPPKRRPGLSMPSSKGARIGIAAVAAAVVVVVVLLLVLGGGSSNSSNTASVAEAPSGSAVSEATEAAEKGSTNKEVTKAVLSAEDGSEAQGIAIFGRVKNKLALQIVAEGLEQLPTGQSYAIWIAASPTRMLPLAASPVNKKGQIASQFEVPTELLAYLANETFDEIAVTKASVSQLNATLKTAAKTKQAPSYTGTPVMRGTITGPIIGAAKRLEEEKGSSGGK
jgi:hypothetical protein